MTPRAGAKDAARRCFWRRQHRRKSMSDTNGKPPVRTRPSVANLQKGKGGQAQPWTFPKNTLEDAIKIPKAVEDKNGGNPMTADLLVRAVGYKKSNDWR